MTHWATDYIGIPWVNGGQDLDGFDCWGFVRHIQLVHYHRELPVVDVDATKTLAVVRALTNHPEHDRWAHVMTPQDGDCVEMGNAARPFHVGLWVDVEGGAVLHCVQGAGVVLSSLPTLIPVWGKIDFWRFKGAA